VIPEEGLECFDKVSDLRNTQLYSSGDIQLIIQLIKQQTQSKCLVGAAEIGKFLDAVVLTFKSLPNSFVADAKTYGVQVQALGTQIGQTVSSGGINVQQQPLDAFKQKIPQLAKLTATFTSQLASYPDSNRQAIASAFPKLQPFITGPNIVEVLNNITALYKAVGSGNFDVNTLATEFQQLKPALLNIWKQYTTQNADGLKQAGLLLGKDLTQVNVMFNTQAFGSVDPNGVKFGGQASQSNSGVSNVVAQPIEQGVQQLKEPVNEFQQPLASGQASINNQAPIKDQPSNAAAGVSVN